MTRVSRYVDSFDRVPNSFTEPRLYASAVGEVIRKRGVSLVLPVHEDFVPLQQFRDYLPPDVTIAAPSHQDGVLALDKWNLIQRAKSAGIPVPETFSPRSIKEAQWTLERIAMPAVVKPRRGNGGKGVSVIFDPKKGLSEYRRIVRRFALDNSTLPLIQQHIAGVQMGSCFISDSGQIKASFVEMYERCKQAGFGTSVVREPARNSEIQEYTARLCKELNWTGVGHLDFIVAGSPPRPYLLEMNPRFWGALNLAIQNGFNFPLALISLATARAVDSRCFLPRSAVNSLWIAGELMASLDDIRRGMWKEALQTPIRLLRSQRYDDFRLRDPLPLLVELAYYFTGFLRAKGDINPVSVGMINDGSERLCSPSK
jgi:predicted ATP-grasp superfamily ATP-dependent carboligase